MATPKKVLEEAEKAEKLHAELLGKDEGSPEGSVKPDGDDGTRQKKTDELQETRGKTAEDTHGDSPQGEQAKGERQNAAEGVEDGQKPPAPPEGQQQKPGEDEEKKIKEQPEEPTRDYKAEYEALSKESEKLKHAYSVLKGKYNAETKRLRDRIKQNEAELEDARKSQQTMGDNNGVRKYRDDLVEEYGEEFVDKLDKYFELQYGKPRSQEDAGAHLKDDGNGDNATPATDAETKQSASDEDVFLAELTIKVPDWETVKDDPGFAEYLQEFDPLIGDVRLNKARDAQASLDASRLAPFFIDYKAQKAKIASLSGNNAVNTPVAKSKEHLVAPSVEKGNNRPTAGEQKKTYSRQEVDEFYKQVQTGTFRGTQEQKAALDAEYTRAAIEGRIV